MIYVTLLIGVMARHAKSNGPIILTVPAALYLIYCCYRFRVGFSYDMLPFQDVAAMPKEPVYFHIDDEEPDQGVLAYTQRELTDPIHTPWAEAAEQSWWYDVPNSATTAASPS